MTNQEIKFELAKLTISTGMPVEMAKRFYDWIVEPGEHKIDGWTSTDEEELKIALDTLENAGQYDSACWLKNLCLPQHNLKEPEQ